MLGGTKQPSNRWYNKLMTDDERKAWEQVQRQAVGLVRQSAKMLGQEVEVKVYIKSLVDDMVPTQKSLNDWRKSHDLI